MKFDYLVSVCFSRVARGEKDAARNVSHHIVQGRRSLLRRVPQASWHAARALILPFASSSCCFAWVLSLMDADYHDSGVLGGRMYALGSAKILSDKYDFYLHFCVRRFTRVK